MLAFRWFGRFKSRFFYESIYALIYSYFRKVSVLLFIFSYTPNSRLDFTAHLSIFIKRPKKLRAERFALISIFEHSKFSWRENIFIWFKLRAILDEC